MSCQEIACVAVGDGAVGKTCLLIVGSKGEYTEDYVPTWVPDIRRTNPHTPIILVGCKSDLRSQNQSQVSKEEAKALAKSIGAVTYMECSARLNEGVRELFETATLVGAGLYTGKKGHKCIVM